MIQGIITPDREALVQLTVLGPDARQATIDTVIDTGFTDFLTLPQTVVDSLGLVFAAPTQATLADGSVVLMHYYWARVEWDGAPRDILVLAAEGGALVGMGMLYGHNLFAEVVDGGSVTIVRRD